MQLLYFCNSIFAIKITSDADMELKSYTNTIIYYINILYWNYIKVILLGCSCSFSDTAEYRISALNVKGESSAFAPVIIKSEYFF